MFTRSVTVTRSDILLIGVVGFFEVVGRGLGGAEQQNCSSNKNNNKRKKKRERKKERKKKKKKKGCVCVWGGGGNRKTKYVIHQLQLIRQNILLP